MEAETAADQDRAWAAFVDEYSRLILHTARRASKEHDDVMDRYTYVLGRLREDDFRRLKAFSLNGTGKFTTWLVVVARRLCVDHHRSVHGRRREGSAVDDVAQVARGHLAGLVVSDVDPDDIAAEVDGGAEAQLLRRERNERLAEALTDLDTRDQLLLTLRYVDGHSPAEVARMLGFSSRFAVRRRLTALLHGLRARLTERGIDG